MKGYIINGSTDEHGTIDIEPCLKEWYRLIGCRCVDFAVRNVGGKDYNIICDDEALLKPNRVTGYDMHRNYLGEHERLAGTLIIFGIDENNYDHGCKSLTDDDVLAIQRRIVDSIFANGEEHPVLWYGV